MLNESRLQSIDKDNITFSYKDYADNNRCKHMSLAGKEFIRRYLSHILPKGLMRVRHFGFLANCCRRKKLGAIRQQLLSVIEIKEDDKTERPITCWPCPACKVGVLVLKSEVNVQRILSG